MFRPAKVHSPELAAQFAKLEPWVSRFRIGGADYGGKTSSVGDVRLAQFFRFVPRPGKILELGSLEGAHTIQLASQRGVTRVVALEGRAANIRKAELVQRLFRIRNAEFVQANLEEADLRTFGQFDAVFCCGLLYHLPEPWKLLEQLPRVAPALFIWTHYADDLCANEVRQGLRGQVHVEGGPNEPLSGMSETAFWPTLGSLLKLLTTSGYKTIHVIKNDAAHQNSPAVTVAASLKEDER